MNSSTLHTATPNPKHARLCLALLVLLAFSLGCSEFVVIGIESDLANGFGVSISTIGQLISLFALPYAVCTPLLALTTGRFKRYRLLLVYAALFCLGNLMSAVAQGYEMLLVARILIGSVSGALLAEGITFIPELVSPKRMSLVISIVYAAYSVAMVIVTSVGKIVADTMGWHYVMDGVFVLAILVCVAIAAVMPRSGETDEAASFAEQVRLFSEPSVIFGMLIFVFGVGSVYTFYGYITPYLEQILNMNTIRDEHHAHGIWRLLFALEYSCRMDRHSLWDQGPFGDVLDASGGALWPVRGPRLHARSPCLGILLGHLDVSVFCSLRLAFHARSTQAASQGAHARKFAGAHGVQRGHLVWHRRRRLGCGAGRHRSRRSHGGGPRANRLRPGARNDSMLAKTKDGTRSLIAVKHKKALGFHPAPFLVTGMLATFSRQVGLARARGETAGVLYPLVDPRRLEDIHHIVMGELYRVVCKQGIIGGKGIARHGVELAGCDAPIAHLKIAHVALIN